jgi:hypothetical protein
MFKHFNVLKLLLWNERGNVDGGGTPPEVVWPEDLDKTYHGNPSLLKYVDKDKKALKVGELAKAYVHASQAIGNKIAKPSDSWAPDQWKEFYQSIGVPAEEDKYTLKNTVPEGMKPDEESFKQFRKMVMEQGLLPRQAQPLLDYYNKLQADANKKSKEFFENAMKGNVDKVKEEWGNAYERKVQSVDAVLKDFASEEEIKSLKESGFYFEPAFMRIFDKIAGKYREDGGPGNLPPNELSMDEIMKQIKEFHDPKHPYRNKMHPQNAYYTKKFYELNGALAKIKNRGAAASHLS